MADGAAPRATDLERLAASAAEACALLKSMAHEGRLMILCALAGGERSVSELEALLGTRQSFISQQLARLRLEGIVSARRDGRSVIYAITDRRAEALVGVLHAMFCADEGCETAAHGEEPAVPG